MVGVRNVRRACVQVNFFYIKKGWIGGPGRKCIKFTKGCILVDLFAVGWDEGQNWMSVGGCYF